MKGYLHFLLLIIPLLYAFPSCIDNDYDVDELNKNAIFGIPPIPLGNVDSMYFNQLGNISLPPEISIPDVKHVFADTIKGLFSKEDISQFFPHHVEDGDFSAFVAKIDIGLADIDNRTNIVFLFEVLDDSGDVINGIVIPRQTVEVEKDQNFRIEFRSEYMKYMEKAKDLKLTIVVTASIPTRISTDDFIYIKSMSLQTSGLHFRF